MQTVDGTLRHEVDVVDDEYLRLMQQVTETLGFPFTDHLDSVVGHRLSIERRLGLAGVTVGEER
jgi:hypothetical protein